MYLTNHDQAVIEKALKFAAANTTDYKQIGEYVHVWQKLANVNMVTAMQTDGFRYDYDD